MGLGRLIALLLYAAGALALAACGSSATTNTSKPQADGGIAAELSATPAPAGVDAAVWEQLKAELERSVSTPPSAPTAATKLTYDAEASALSWGYCAPGDYNQDGEVGIGDLTPLGLHFGETSPDGAGQPFPWDSVGAVVDGDANGTIGISDVTPIGASFGRRVAGYHVYRSFDSADYPQTPTAANGPGALTIGTVPLAQATGAAAAGRKQFSLPLTNPQAGAYYWVRPYDGADEGTPSNLAAGAGANLPPIAALAADPPAGPVPLSVHFSAQASYDADGSLVKYEWDFDGPLNGEQWEDTGATPTAEHTYDKSGDYFPTLRVTDDRGLTDTDFAQVSVKSPPVARLDFTGVTDIYKHLLWDASGSTDADGEVVKYEWDFDGDGVYEYDASAGGETASQQALQDFYYYESGEYTVGVRVTDDDGLSATASKTAALVVAMTWHTVTADSKPDTCDDRGNIIVAGISPALSLLEVDQRPALVYTRGLDIHNDEYNTNYGQAYLIANDSSGAIWPEPQPIPGTTESCKALVVDGLPAVLVSLGKDYTHVNPPGLYSYEYWTVYMRAADAAGTSWPIQQELAHWLWNYDRTEWEGKRLDYLYEFLSVDGVPAVIGQIGIGLPNVLIRALDSSGSSWPPDYQELNLGLISSDRFVEVGGRLAFLELANNEDILFNRAEDVAASAWAAPVLVDKLEKPSEVFRLLDVAGCPAVVYYDDSTSALKYRRALDAAGTTWEDPVVISPAAAKGFLRAAIMDGRPLVIYRDRIDDQMKLIAANDSIGKLWGLSSGMPDVQAAAIYGNMAFSEETICPAFAYVTDQPLGLNQSESQLQYLAYN